jgi:hypothetical protein
MTEDDCMLAALWSLPKSKYMHETRRNHPEYQLVALADCLQFIYRFLVFLLVPFLWANLCNFNNKWRRRTSKFFAAGALLGAVGRRGGAPSCLGRWPGLGFSRI